MATRGENASVNWTNNSKWIVWLLLEFIQKEHVNWKESQLKTENFKSHTNFSFDDPILT